MVFRPIFVSLILLASNVFAQFSNSPNFFTFLSVSNQPINNDSAIQSTGVTPENEKEKKNAKPQGVTLPDGTFIPNKPVKTPPAQKDKYEIYQRFLQNPRFAAEMAEQGVQLAQEALANKSANQIIPLDNVRAMYAIAVFLEKGFHCKQDKDASLEWITKAAFAGRIGISGGERADNDKLSDEEITQATKILENGIKEKAY